MSIRITIRVPNVPYAMKGDETVWLLKSNIFGSCPVIISYAQGLIQNLG